MVFFSCPFLDSVWIPFKVIHDFLAKVEVQVTENLNLDSLAPFMTFGHSDPSLIQGVFVPLHLWCSTMHQSLNLPSQSNCSLNCWPNQHALAPNVCFHWTNSSLLCLCVPDPCQPSPKWIPLSRKTFGYPPKIWLCATPWMSPFSPQWMRSKWMKFLNCL